jgi:hypothetical protein
MVRCGAHLSNLALGGSKVALRLFGTKVVQETFESEVVSALKRATNAEDKGRQTLTSRGFLLPRASDAKMEGIRRALRIYERQTQ